MKRHIMLAALSLAVLVTTLCGCPSTEHSLVYDQSNYGEEARGSSLVGQQVAQRITMAPGLSTIGMVTWWGAGPATSGTDSFIIRIFTDNGSGYPNINALYSLPVGAASRENTGDTTSPEGWRIYQYTAEIPYITLDPGMPYYLSIINQGVPTWAWMATDAGSDVFVGATRSGDSGVWSTILGWVQAFELWD